MAAMDTLLSVLKATQFVKHLLSIYYVPSTARSIEAAIEPDERDIVSPRPYRPYVTVRRHRSDKDANKEAR